MLNHTRLVVRVRLIPVLLASMMLMICSLMAWGQVHPLPEGYTGVPAASAREILIPMLTAVESNYQRIRTVSGWASVDTQVWVDYAGDNGRTRKRAAFAETPNEDTFVQSQHALLTFAIDRPARCSFTRWSAQEGPTFRGRHSGQAIPRKPGYAGYASVTIVTPERCIIVEPYSLADDGISVASWFCEIHKAQPDPVTENRSSPFSPLRVYGMWFPEQWPVWAYLSYNVARIDREAANYTKEPYPLSWDLAQSVDGSQRLLRMTHHVGNASPLIQECTFGRDSGWNIIEFKQHRGERLESYHTLGHYVQADGIWYPTQAICRLYDDTGELDTQRHYVFRDMQLNEQIATTRFSIESAELLNGDIVVDYPQQRQFIWRDGALAPSPPEVEDYLSRAKAREASIQQAIATQPAP